MVFFTLIANTHSRRISFVKFFAVETRFFLFHIFKTLLAFAEALGVLAFFFPLLPIPIFFLEVKIIPSDAIYHEQ